MSNKSPWRFYVYALIGEGGSIMYVGKGSGVRLKYQMRRYNLHGVELLRCKTEKESYRQERRKIVELLPPLNRNLGGGGSWCTPIRVPRVGKDKWTRLCDRIGTRAMAARIVLAAYHVKPEVAPLLDDPSILDTFRRVAYGSGT